MLVYLINIDQPFKIKGWYQYQMFEEDGVLHCFDWCWDNGERKKMIKYSFPIKNIIMIETCQPPINPL
jgi:hypothetical protein